MAGRPLGLPKTGGRQKGIPNKASIAKERAIAASGLTPLDYMLAVLRDEREPTERRMWAAEKAASYVHPKLASVVHQGDEEKPLMFGKVERRIVDARD